MRVATTALLTLAPVVLGAQVRFERTGYRLTSIGERLAVSARVGDGRRRPVSTANIRWRIADPTIATVTPQGIVVSRKAGYTKLWAVAGVDSASALILVDQWAAKFDFSPSVVRFDAVGASVPLKLQVRDAAGHVIDERNRRGTQCRSLNERVASLGPAGEVLSHANGVTYVRCTDRGIADSVRVEVRQRALRAAIADKLTYGTKMVGDTFRIRIAAYDRAGDEIKDVQATWASLSPTMVSVDPLTGLARVLGPGAVKIVGQVGDATDTLAIQVAVGPGMSLPVVVAGDTVVTGGAESRGPALVLPRLYLAEGDTGTVTVAARDALGQAVANPDVSLRTSDTSIVQMLPRKRVVARKSGVSYIVGQFGGIIDSVQISVRPKALATAGSAMFTATHVFVRPRVDTTALARYAAQRRAAAEAIKKSSSVAEYSGRLIGLSGLAEQSAHSTRLSSVFMERRTGLLYGGMLEIAPDPRVRLTGSVRTGLLSNDSPTGEDMTVTEAEGDLTLAPAPWFGVRGGYVMRSTKTDLAAQQWRFPRASAVTRLPFVGGAVVAVMGVSILPAAQYTGHKDTTGRAIQPNPFSLSGETGLELHSGPFSATVQYYVERFTFPILYGEKRRDEFSSLRIRLGLQRGR